VISPSGEERSLVDEIRQICAGHAGRTPRERRHVHVIGDGLVPQVDAENALAAPEVWRINDDLTVESTRT
jgi:hypothetical protein